MSLVVEDVDSFVRKRGRKRRGVEVEKDGRRETKLRKNGRKQKRRERANEREEGEGKRREKKKYACHSALSSFQLMH